MSLFANIASEGRSDLSASKIDPIAGCNTSGVKAHTSCPRLECTCYATDTRSRTQYTNESGINSSDDNAYFSNSLTK
jgi:hypothetical protein